jgi:AcrR family transcriptional regulator
MSDKVAPADDARSAAARHLGNRYGRSESARTAILQAADDLVLERGFDGLTMEGIAARAGVAKQTIYRWWSTKADVLLDAFLQDAVKGLNETARGDLEVDLPAYLRRLAAFLDKADTGATFRALLSHGHLDRSFGERFRTEVVSVRRAYLRSLLDGAVQRGQLPEVLDVDAEIDQLVGPLFYRALVSCEPVEVRFADLLVTEFFRRAGVVK